MNAYYNTKCGFDIMKDRMICRSLRFVPEPGLDTRYPDLTVPETISALTMQSDVAQHCDIAYTTVNKK
jgi:hypothetical protein